MVPFGDMSSRGFAFAFMLYAIFATGALAVAQKKDAKSSYDKFKLRSKGEDAEYFLRAAQELKLRDPVQALNTIEQALALSIAAKDLFSEARCYVLIGEINEQESEWQLALQSYLKSYQYLKDNHFTSPEYRTAVRGLANCHLKLQEFDLALRYYNEALAAGQNEADRNDRRLDLSEVYYQKEEYNTALQILERINIGKVADPTFESRVQNQQAKIYARLNDLEKTRSLFDNSLNTRRGVNRAEVSDKDVQQTKEEISEVLVEQKRYDEEIDLRNSSISYNTDQKNFSEVTRDKVAISKALTNSGKSAAALTELQEATRIADTLRDPREQRNAWLALARLYDDIGQTKESVSAYRKYSEAVARVDLYQDSVLSGRSAIIKKQKDIEELTKDVSIGQREEAIARATVSRQRLVIYGLLVLVLVALVTSWFIYRSARSRQIANQKLALKSLRSQMNPHFIFNALNSVNQFVAQQDERSANRFLSEFSQLMRLVLDNSQQDFIPLHKEQEMLSLYLKLEHYRFRDKFDYAVHMDEDINAEAIEVPPMLIQPYIENAVWHGLRYKDQKGHLGLRFFHANGDLVVEVKDDGIGRKRSSDLKTPNQRKHNSTGLKNIEERLSIINKIYKTNYRVTIDDLPDEGGTCVQIYLPRTQHR